MRLIATAVCKGELGNYSDEQHVVLKLPIVGYFIVILSSLT